MRIPLTDVSWQHRTLRTEIDAAIWRLLDEQTCDGGAQLLELEAALGAWLGGVRAAGVQSGTAGLFLALKALGIGPGDEVITVPNSDLPTTAAISHTGARFVLVDVEPRAFTIDVAQAEAAITPRTRAILPVHLYGHPADMDPIMEIARRRGLLVVEDACLALGAEYKGHWCGTMGQMGVYSFAPRKMLGGAGNGGAVVTCDPELDRRLRMLRGYGLSQALTEMPISSRLQQPYLPHDVEGYNLRLDGLNAAMVSVKLPHLHEWLAHRRAVADRYAAHFSGTAVVTPQVLPGCRHPFRNYAVQLPHRDAVRAYLREQGIVSSVLYAPPVHLQPVYRHLGLGPGSFPVAEELASRIVCLPMYPGVSMEAVDEIAGAVLEGAARGRSMKVRVICGSLGPDDGYVGRSDLTTEGTQDTEERGRRGGAEGYEAPIIRRCRRLREWDTDGRASAPRVPRPARLSFHPAPPRAATGLVRDLHPVPLVRRRADGVQDLLAAQPVLEGRALGGPPAGRHRPHHMVHQMHEGTGPDGLLDAG